MSDFYILRETLAFGSSYYVLWQLFYFSVFAILGAIIFSKRHLLSARIKFSSASRVCGVILLIWNLANDIYLTSFREIDYVYQGISTFFIHLTNLKRIYFYAVSAVLIIGYKELFIIFLAPIVYLCITSLAQSDDPMAFNSNFASGIILFVVSSIPLSTIKIKSYSFALLIEGISLNLITTILFVLFAFNLKSHFDHQSLMNEVMNQDYLGLKFFYNNNIQIVSFIISLILMILAQVSFYVGFNKYSKYMSWSETFEFIQKDVFKFFFRKKQLRKKMKDKLSLKNINDIHSDASLPENEINLLFEMLYEENSKDDLDIEWRISKILKIFVKSRGVRAPAI